MAGRTIVTRNAIVNGVYALINSHEKYFLPQSDVYGARSLIIAVYRRFFRLKPFVSNRAMVKETYRDYLRYKFRHEDYAMKRSVVLGNTPRASSLQEELTNSLLFVTKAVCYLPQTKDKRFDIAADNTSCRQILKNLLSVEYEKQLLISRHKHPLKLTEKKGPYQIYRTEFTHMRHSNQSAQFRVLGEFDACLIYMNDTLNTRL